MIISQKLLDGLSAQAKASPRLRMNMDLRNSSSDGSQRMLSDIWSPLDLHDSVTGWRGKLALAGNTWRARWKYRQFTDMSWLKALWIQAKGVLLEKEVRL